MKVYFWDQYWKIYFYSSITAIKLQLDFDQCDQIGKFLKVFVDNFSYKSSPNI